MFWTYVSSKTLSVTFNVNQSSASHSENEQVEGKPSAALWAHIMPDWANITNNSQKSLKWVHLFTLINFMQPGKYAYLSDFIKCTPEGTAERSSRWGI